MRSLNNDVEIGGALRVIYRDLISKHESRQPLPIVEQTALEMIYSIVRKSLLHAHFSRNVDFRRHLARKLCEHTSIVFDEDDIVMTLDECTDDRKWLSVSVSYEGRTFFSAAINVCDDNADLDVI
jgi:hypothetical protein